jgi:transcriptional regulator with XRE-family HTH domain
MYSFSDNLKTIRKKRGMSQAQLADKLGISQRSVSHYEENTRYPTIDKVYDIARALDVTIEELISEH